VIMSEENPTPEASIDRPIATDAQVPPLVVKPTLVYREPAVLTLPDWKGASASHWLTQWEHQHGLRRVVQHDWLRPLRGDWMMQLQEAVLKFEQCHLLAHGLGAHLVDAWLQHTQQARRVLSVTLIDPIDMQDSEWRESLFTWKPLPRQRWRVPATVLWKERSVTPGVSALLDAWGASSADAGQPLGAGVVAGWALLPPHWQTQEQLALQRAVQQQLIQEQMHQVSEQKQPSPATQETPAPDAAQG
jgi:predicted alpha/beta hydrolase family esterase